MIAGDGYIVVFDMASQPYRDWVWAFWPVFMVFVFLFARWYFYDAFGKAFATLLAVFSFALAPVVVWGSWYEYRRLSGAFARGEYQILEGRVTKFQPDPPDRRRPQYFEVGGHRFSQWGPEKTPAFHRTFHSGGPDLTGQCVKISFNERNEILWLGIRRSGCADEPVAADIGPRE